MVSEHKAERERQGVTLAELEERTGIDRAALSRLETGKAGNPTIGTIDRVALALGTAVGCVLHNAPPGPSEPADCTTAARCVA